LDEVAESWAYVTDELNGSGQGGMTALRLSSAATTALRARAKGAYLAALDAPLGSDGIVQLVTGDTTACWTCPVPD